VPVGGRGLRIAQVSPLSESVPPRLYGGTERVVSYLTEALFAAGHDVTLFASGDSTTSARLVAGCPRSLRLDPTCRDPLAHHVTLVHEVMRRAQEFDLIHFHVDYVHYPLVERVSVPTLTTLHGRLDIPDLVPLYRSFRHVPVISISDAQRRPLPWLNWRGTVHHGLPSGLHRYHGAPGGYLVFLGRISPDKRPDRAIEIARHVGLPLKISAKVDAADREYFTTTVKPLLDNPGTEFLGEIGEAEKGDLLGNARALLFPIDWPEPFGLVLIEALACGTPIIAFPHGAVPEIVEDGVNGFLVDSVEEAAAAVARVDEIDRRRCRETFERRFTAAHMARRYLALYREAARPATFAGDQGSVPWKTTS